MAWVGGDALLPNEFLAGLGVYLEHDWSHADTAAAHAAWSAHIRRRRNDQGPKRPLADILIGAFAMRFQGLLTRNPADFRTAFPSLELKGPNP